MPAITEAHRFMKDGEAGYHDYAEENGLEIAILGKEFEITFAKYSGLPWTACNEMRKDYTKGDVGEFQLRATKYIDGHLTLRAWGLTESRYRQFVDQGVGSDIKNHSGKIFILGVSGVSSAGVPGFYLPGYFRLDAQKLKDDWLTNYGNSREIVYGVPQSALLPISDLKIKLDT